MILVEISDIEILTSKINLEHSILNDKEKELFYKVIHNNNDVFSMWDEIGTCLQIQVHLKLRDETPFFVRPYPIREMDRLVILGTIKKGQTGYSSPVLLVKRKQQNFYHVYTDFRDLNDRLFHINHTFPLVWDCIEAIGKSECEVMSVLDLRDTYHTLRLTNKSQKFCGITPYYGSPTYFYLRLGMEISVSPAIW